jgi:cyclophilin family peptidyl-prolyl cis-trans isomerase
MQLEKMGRGTENVRKNHEMSPPWQDSNERSNIMIEEGGYKVIETIGVSRVSWEEAAKNAIESATKTFKGMRTTRNGSGGSTFFIQLTASLKCTPGLNIYSKYLDQYGL